MSQSDFRSGRHPAHTAPTPETLKSVFAEALDRQRSGQLDLAASAYHQILARDPDHVDALNMLGVALHQLGRSEEAEGMFLRALSVRTHPNIHMHLGNLYSEIGRNHDAAQQYQQSITLMQKELRRFELGTPGQPHANPAQIAGAYMTLGNAELNLAILQKAMMSGQVGNRAKHAESSAWNLEAARSRFQMVLTWQPGNLAAMYSYALVCRESARADEAIRMLEQVLAHTPDDANVLTELANLCRTEVRTTEAAEYYRRILRLKPHDAAAMAQLARILERSQRPDEARDHAEKALALDPNSVLARYVMALLDYRGGNLQASASKLESLIASRSLEQMTAEVWHQLGHVYDRMGRYYEAYGAFRTANMAEAKSPAAVLFSDEAGRQTELIRLLGRWTTGERVSSWRFTASPDSQDTPVFMVGFPRSGTTLLDQMLNAHPRIVVIEEQETLMSLQNRYLSDPAGLDLLDTIDVATLASARSEYFSVRERCATKKNPERLLSDAILVDKYPLYIISLPLIYRLFPEARVIVSLRDPRDACLSNFMQHYKLNVSMFHFLDMDSTIQYYADVMGNYLHYREVLPLAIHELRYEDLIADPESRTREICAFLGIDWHEDTLSYRRGLENRMISTPSYRDVARPLYRDSIGRWRHYEQRIPEAFETLEPFVRAFSYA